MAPVTEQIRTVRLLRGAVALRAYREERGLSHKQFAPTLGVSHATLIAWERGQSIPGEERWVKIEEACPVVDPATNAPAVNAETGRIVSHCPREYWQPMAPEAA